MRFSSSFAVCAAAIAVLNGSLLVRADEPGWTHQQRLEQRDTVCVAKVLSFERAGRIDEGADVVLAVIEVSGIKKGETTSVGSKLNVYYEAAGARPSKRCPARAELTKGEKGTFYLRTMTAAIQESLHLKSVKQPAHFLEMASDVQKTAQVLTLNAEAGSVVITAGGDDGAAVGDVLSVYRGELPIGRLAITEIKPDESTASITALQGVEKLQAGDEVVSDGTFQFLLQLRLDSKLESPEVAGREYAAGDIGRGRVRILYYGKPWSQGKPFVDDATGYPVTITDGCIVGEDSRRFVDEYNLAMREHFKRSR